MATRDIVLVGASAGGIPALLELVGHLKRFQGAMLVAVHVSPDSPAMLPTLLGRAGMLEANFPEGGDPIESGHVSRAPDERERPDAEGGGCPCAS